MAKIVINIDMDELEGLVSTKLLMTICMKWKEEEFVCPLSYSRFRFKL